MIPCANRPEIQRVLRESMGLAVREINRMAALLQAELAMLCHSWRIIHGDH